MAQKRLDNTYDAFLSAIRPIAISLHECTASLDRERYFEQLEGGRAVGAISSEYTLGALSKDGFTVSARLRFDVIARDTAGGDPPLRIAAVYDADFQSAQAVPKKFALKFADAEARLVFWPYFREFIASMTARMSITPLVMPFSTDTKA